MSIQLVPAPSESGGGVTAVDGQSGDVDLSGIYAPLSAVQRQPLVVDGTVFREGVGGPVWKTWGGYNIHVIPNVYASSMMLDTQAKLDDYFSQCPPNQLHRVMAYAPGPTSGISWATQIATLKNCNDTAKRYGQRIAFRLTNWTKVGSTSHYADAFDTKDATWWTSQTYKHSVSGSTSFEDWCVALATAVDADCWDLLNEPDDSGGTNTAAIASFVTYMAAAIKAVRPAALITMGINLASKVGGQPQYQTIMAGADYGGLHTYVGVGYLTIADPIINACRALGKPYIIDEHGVFAKANYGAATDPDKSSNGRPAVSFQAQGRLTKRLVASSLALKDCAGLIYYSWPGTQTDGLGHYEPPKGSLAVKVIREAKSPGDEFSFDTLGSNVGAWLDGCQNFNYQPGASVPLWFQRHANQPNGVAITGGALSGRFGEHASFQFSGTQWIDQNSWQVGNSAHTLTFTNLFALVPTALPSAGNYAYLVGPKAAAATFGMRINSAGNVEVLATASTGGSAAGTVQATSTNAVLTGQVNTLAVTWDPVGGGLTLILNGVLLTVTGKTASLGVGSARIGCGYDGLNGFVGHLLEAIYEGAVETPTNVGLTLAYFGRRYDS